MRCDRDASPSLPPENGRDLPSSAALVSVLPFSVFITDSQGRIRSANVMAACHVNLSVDQLDGRSVFDVLTPNSAEECRLKYARLKEEADHAIGTPVTWEGYDHGRDFEYTLIAIPDPTGPMHHVVIFIKDISERKRAQLASRMRDRRYRYIVDNSGDTFWEVDEQMRFTFISANDKRERGYDPEEVLGQSIFSILTPASQEQVKRDMNVRQNLERRGTHTGAMRYEVEVWKKDGTTLWVEAQSMPYRDGRGAIRGFHGATRNISERKHFEMALWDANQQLHAQIQEITTLQQRLEEQANRDFLTGLHNRRYLADTLPRELIRAKQKNRPVSLIMIDLDHFKHVNDTYGHAAGDAVLKTLAGILQREARESDLICRYGGEEFLVVLPNTPRSAALSRAETWRTALEKTPVTHGPCRIFLSLSAGIATFPDDGTTMGWLLRLADAALYHAKQSGRNRVNSCEPHEHVAEYPPAPISLVWSPAYACGHVMIDAEHQELFRLANILLDISLDAETTNESFKLALHDLVSHVVIHFSHEEAILRRCGYAQLSEHAEEHQQLVERASQFEAQAERNAIPISELIAFLVNDVVANHMLKADHAFYFLFEHPSSRASVQDD